MTVLVMVDDLEEEGWDRQRKEKKERSKFHNVCILEERRKYGEWRRKGLARPDTKKLE